MIIEKLDLNITYNKKKLEEFLEKQELKYEKVDSIYVVFENNKNIIASAGRYKNILKLIAVDNNYKGTNLTSDLISNLLKELLVQGYEDYYIFTKSENIKNFSDIGFKPVIDTGKVTLLHKGINDIYTVLNRFKSIRDEIKNFNVGTIIMNANPFTLGHKYLVDKSLEKVEKLLIFVVETDESFFSFGERFNLVKKGLRKYDRIYILPSTDYIISNSTFPTYFIKDISEVHKEYAKLDLMIFEKYFIPYFNISKRFVGKETIDGSTKIYNDIMKKYLGNSIGIHEIERKKYNGIDISASKVRKSINKGEFNFIKQIVPDSTYDFLVNKYEKH